MDPNELHAIDRAICGEVWAGDGVRRNLEKLCLDCGNRFAGSESERCAVDLIMQIWRDYGLSDVRAEPFPFVAWERGSASLAMTAPAHRSYPCIALPYAPASDLEAELVDLGYGLEADFQQAGEAVRGKVVLVTDGVPPGGGRPVHRMEKYMRAKMAGAVAFLFMSNEPGMLAPTGSLAFDQAGSLDQALPSAGLACEVGLDLRRWARPTAASFRDAGPSRGPVRLRLQMDNRLRSATSWNVVGDIPGQNPDDGRLLLVGAHMDGHDISQAAVDNGSGTIAITEIARVLALLQPMRAAPQGQETTAWPAPGGLPCTVRFVCFGVEELGLIGAHAYVREHQAELDRVQFMFNLDIVGTGGATTFAMQNCPELVPHFQTLGEELAAETNVTEMLVPFSDQFPFVLQGVPAAFIHSAGEKGERGWAHTSADTLDKVNLQSVRMAAAAVARLVVRLAHKTTPWPGRRRAPDEVKGALQAQGLESVLRLLGAWPF